VIDESGLNRLARYFANECSREEALATEAWMNENAERRHEAELLREAWTLSDTSTAAGSDEAWQRLSARLDVTAGLPRIGLHRSGEHPTGPRFHWRHASRLSGSARIATGMAVAAMVVVVAGSIVIARRDRGAEQSSPQVADASGEKDREFRTSRGQRAVVLLGDGTRVELGVETFMHVRLFHNGPRQIDLVGQAVFDVAHDSLRPFTVRSANAITEDIGTRFVVRAYPGERQVKVLVTAGRVALRAVDAPAASGTILGPEDLGTLDSAGRTTVKNDAPSRTLLAWTEDRFVVDDAPLSDVLPDIARWFDVTIALDNPEAGHRRVTMSVPARSLSAVLGAATVPLGLHFDVKNRTVVIR
jgi:transmembrane sensor